MATKAFTRTVPAILASNNPRVLGFALTQDNPAADVLYARESLPREALAAALDHQPPLGVVIRLAKHRNVPADHPVIVDLLTVTAEGRRNSGWWLENTASVNVLRAAFTHESLRADVMGNTRVPEDITRQVAFGEWESGWRELKPELLTDDLWVEAAQSYPQRFTNWLTRQFRPSNSGQSRYYKTMTPQLTARLLQAAADDAARAAVAARVPVGEELDDLLIGLFHDGDTDDVLTNIAHNPCVSTRVKAVAWKHGYAIPARSTTWDDILTVFNGTDGFIAWLRDHREDEASHVINANIDVDSKNIPEAVSRAILGDEDLARFHAAALRFGTNLQDFTDWGLGHPDAAVRNAVLNSWWCQPADVLAYALAHADGNLLGWLLGGFTVNGKPLFTPEEVIDTMGAEEFITWMRQHPRAAVQVLSAHREQHSTKKVTIPRDVAAEALTSPLPELRRVALQRGEGIESDVIAALYGSDRDDAIAAARNHHLLDFVMEDAAVDPSVLDEVATILIERSPAAHNAVVERGPQSRLQFVMKKVANTQAPRRGEAYEEPTWPGMIAHRPVTERATMLRLFLDEKEAALVEVLDSTDPSVIHRLVTKLTPVQREWAAVAHPRVLSTHPSPTIRQWVAKTTTDQNILLLLRDDKVSGVRTAAGERYMELLMGDLDGNAAL